MQLPQVVELLSRSDPAGLEAVAGLRLSRVVRYLMGRLYSHDEDEKWRAVKAIGFLASAPELMDDKTTRELLRRFMWAMSDESGGVPFGIPEAMGELLVQRPAFQDEYVPLLCSMLTSDEMVQTGPIERGVVWALGRLGPVASGYSDEAVDIVRDMARTHPDPHTRSVAADTLARIAAEER